MAHWNRFDLDHVYGKEEEVVGEMNLLELEGVIARKQYWQPQSHDGAKANFMVVSNKMADGGNSCLGHICEGRCVVSWIMPHMCVQV